MTQAPILHDHLPLHETADRSLLDTLFADPRAAMLQLDPWERQGLALLRQMDGLTQVEVLAVGIAASGYSLPLQIRNSWNPAHAMAEYLLRRGLILVTNSYSPDYLDSSSLYQKVF